MKPLPVDTRYFWIINSALYNENLIVYCSADQASRYLRVLNSNISSPSNQYRCRKHEDGKPLPNDKPAVAITLDR